jgi:hypothetical protein
MKLPLMSAVIATALLATPVFAQTKPTPTPAPAAAAPAPAPEAAPAPATDTMKPKKTKTHKSSHKKAAKKTEATPAAADAPK